MAALFSCVSLYAQGPFNVGVVPNNPATAINQTVVVSATWSDNDGAGALQYAYIYVAGCQVYYTPSYIAQYDPDRNAWIPGTKAVGFATARDRICGVVVDKATLEGDQLTVRFYLTFFPGVSPGSYPILLSASDFHQRAATWMQMGTLTLTP